MYPTVMQCGIGWENTLTHTELEVAESSRLMTIAKSVAVAFDSEAVATQPHSTISELLTNVTELWFETPELCDIADKVLKSNLIQHVACCTDIDRANELA